MSDQIKSELYYSILNCSPTQYPYLHYKYDPLLSHKSVTELEKHWPSEDEFKSYDSVFTSAKSKRSIQIEELSTCITMWIIRCLSIRTTGPSYTKNLAALLLFKESSKN